MLNKYRRLSKTMLIVLIGLGTGAVAVSARQQASAGPLNTEISIAQATSTDQPTYCEIQATTTNGLVTIEGVLHSDIALSGAYRFKVTSSSRSGNSNIQQGGNFSARPNDDLTLGRVMMGGQGAIYNASLEIMTGGNTIVCENSIGDTA